ncbi:MAG: SGNH/GDSL hydrolase family protein [Alphaproteobacteria bacterium]|nr:SGNH/GDSL hydrolase family protein [Alphaproteobacteria bacterium]MBN2675513.1 SGNH/GDSL hydrolase family protein [Alphaproteobacteria bacterium]
MKKIIEKISILGDSISKGVILDEISKKYKILKESAADLFSRENHVEIKNHAKFGCTSEKALDIIQNILKSETPSGIIMLELGGNDCDFNWDNVAANPDADHQPNVTLEKFKQNIAKIIQMVKDTGRDLAFMTLPPIDSEKYFNWITRGDKTRVENIQRFLGERNYIYRHQELYAGALEEIATKNNIYKIPVRSGFLSIPRCCDYICDDGIHLNERGQDVMKTIFNNTYNQYLAMK